MHTTTSVTCSLIGLLFSFGFMRSPTTGNALRECLQRVFLQKGTCVSIDITTSILKTERPSVFQGLLGILEKAITLTMDQNTLVTKAWRRNLKPRKSRYLVSRHLFDICSDEILGFEVPFGFPEVSSPIFVVVVQFIWIKERVLIILRFLQRG